MVGKKNGLTAIFGTERVFEDADLLAAYANDISFASGVKPQFVVKPKDAAKVQQVVDWANQTGTPLVPVSSGPPHFHGDTVPSAEGTVVVDLSEMSRIIKIDARNRMAIVEPGVTYAQLQPELAKEGLRLSMPLLPRRNKSVIASLLEREPTMIPKYRWMSSDPLRCLEIVWGNGDRMMTGEAGDFPSIEAAWQAFHPMLNPRGPGQIDYYMIAQAAQGTMGVVTWAALRCEKLPKIQRLFFVSSEKLDGLTDFAYRLLRFRFGDEFLFLNGWNLASILGEGADQIKAMRDKLPPWIFVLSVSGRGMFPEEKVGFLEKDITDIARQFGLRIVSAIPGTMDKQVLDTILKPSQEPYWKIGYKGGCQDIFFLTTLNRTPELVRVMYSVAEEMGYPIPEIGVYLQPVHQGAACHCEFNVPFEPSDVREVTRIRKLLIKASEELAKHGAFFSRPYGIWANMAYDRDKQHTIVLKKVKSIFDPNNVMNPGKLCF